MYTPAMCSREQTESSAPRQLRPAINPQQRIIGALNNYKRARQVSLYSTNTSAGDSTEGEEVGDASFGSLPANVVCQTSSGLSGRSTIVHNFPEGGIWALFKKFGGPGNAAGGKHYQDDLIRDAFVAIMRRKCANREGDHQARLATIAAEANSLREKIMGITKTERSCKNRPSRKGGKRKKLVPRKAGDSPTGPDAVEVDYERAVRTFMHA
ncbi:hypothetical protein NW768_008669 [Fusarium equiseti]|uniref:Uncharacterized protein n=1 Tax=Fusarium equiseti TaxID=61235 RepID=A0ABQ8R4N7_FUSEQ|nr:hypothetical protein NW768_008669 [Fusarium equiseti]